MKLNSRSILLFVFFLPMATNAEILDYSERFSLAFVAQAQEYGLGFENPGSTLAKEVVFSPNTHAMVGVEVNYLGFSLALLNSNSIPPSDRQQKGHTRYHDYRLRFFLGADNRFMINAVTNSYKGFYMEDSHSLLGTPGTDPNYLLPDLRVSNNALSLTYVFSPERYALPNTSVKQTSRGGSWFVRGSFEQIRIENSGAILPPALQFYFEDDRDYTSGKYDTLGVVGGYGYNFIFGKNWLLGLLGGIGPGVQWGEYSTETLRHKIKMPTFLVHAAFTGGYNGENFYALINIEQSTTDLFVQDFDIKSKLGMVRTTIGGRF